MASGTGGDLARRVAVAAVGIPLTVGLVYLGGLWLTLFIAAAAALAARELYAMCERRDIAAYSRSGAALSAAFVLSTTLPVQRFVVWWTIGAIVLLTPSVLRYSGDGDAVLRLPATLVGALYTGGLLTFALWLRAIGGSGPGWRGAAVLFLPIVLTWLGDTAAYFVGRAIGRHKFAPRVSPGKTWEGAVAGLTVAVAAAPLYIDLTGPWVSWNLPLWSALGLGALIAVAGQAGDLVESRLKRDCGVKDSSGLLPGHGGVLDRLDSLLFVFPVSYAYLTLAGSS